MPDDPLNSLIKFDADLPHRIHDAEEYIYQDGALPRKVKLMMGMAFDATHGAVGGVRSIALQAMQAGATKEEIGEALRVACLFGGLGSAYIASLGLKDIL